MLQGLVQGLTNVYETLTGLWDGVRHLFDNINLLEMWESYLPSDILSVMQVLFALLIILCAIGIIKRLLVVFG